MVFYEYHFAIRKTALLSVKLGIMLRIQYLLVKVNGNLSLVAGGHVITVVTVHALRPRSLWKCPQQCVKKSSNRYINILVVDEE